MKSNKSRNERIQSSRSERRNERRAQSNDRNQDADSICVYYMQGKCHRGDDCPYSHNALPPRKMELCKFYLMDCCAKRDKCLYMHHDFPCKFFHTGLKCASGDNCKFSHDPLNEQVRDFYWLIFFNIILSKLFIKLFFTGKKYITKTFRNCP